MLWITLVLLEKKCYGLFMTEDLVKKTADYVRQKLHHEPSGHDWFHVQRVWKTAKFIQKKEGGDLLIIELAALLHNLKEHHCSLCHDRKATLAVKGMMDVIGIDEELQDKIIEVIDDSKYKAGQTRLPKSIEGKIMQDANWLDSLGAVGIARVFASGGYHSRPIYDPAIKIRKYLNYREYLEKKQTTSFNYLHEKVLKVAKLMNTKTAKRLARERLAIVLRFIDEMKKEL